MKKAGKRVAALRAHYARHSELSSEGDPSVVGLRFPRPRRLVAVRLDEETIEGLRRLAARKGLNYSTLMRMWLTERLHLESGEKKA